jgi:hypothetical protein
VAAEHRLRNVDYLHQLRERLRGSSGHSGGWMTDYRAETLAHLEKLGLA